ncbi:hypothetical protein L1987_57523 [Smallanthus sonchifolius]|uniref:Uncharacterized protein n=1 Tax=Smallanthus sonchifolius TaxID=185202 RepID=A0ACB9DCY1_9ASTR|nr:hypothetical protein L1987_57523 [Smallanthus sonchifolius]
MAMPPPYWHLSFYWSLIAMPYTRSMWILKRVDSSEKMDFKYSKSYVKETNIEEVDVNEEGETGRSNLETTAVRKSVAKSLTSDCKGVAWSASGRKRKERSSLKASYPDAHKKLLDQFYQHRLGICLP